MAVKKESYSFNDETISIILKTLKKLKKWEKKVLS